MAKDKYLGYWVKKSEDLKISTIVHVTRSYGAPRWRFCNTYNFYKGKYRLHLTTVACTVDDLRLHYTKITEKEFNFLINKKTK